MVPFSFLDGQFKRDARSARVVFGAENCYCFPCLYRYLRSRMLRTRDWSDAWRKDFSPSPQFDRPETPAIEHNDNKHDESLKNKYYASNRRRDVAINQASPTKRPRRPIASSK